MKTGVRKLTKKQKFFVAEYPKDWDGSKAVIRAGFHPKNAQRAAEMAYQLLHKTPVKEALDRAMEERLRNLEFTVRECFRSSPEWPFRISGTSIMKMGP